MSATSASRDFVDDETPLEVQLRPVIAGLMQDAERLAAQVLEEADEQVAAVLAEARRRAEALLDSARAEGAAAAQRSATRVLADARREAREQILRARRGVYEQVRSLARNRLDRLADTPAAKDLNARLETVAHERMGENATVELSTSGVGVIASAGRRRLDLSGDELVALELADMASLIEELWS